MFNFDWYNVWARLLVACPLVVVAVLIIGAMCICEDKARKARARKRRADWSKRGF